MKNILDLRVNNLLYYNGDVVYINALSLDKEEIEVKKFNSNNKEPIHALLKNVQRLKLTEAWLARFGFKIDVWSTIKISESKTLSLGRTGSPDGLPYHPMLREHIEQGFSIKEAYEIQVAYNDFSDKGLILKRQTISLRPIKYVHEMQNLLYVLMGKEALAVL